MNFFRFGFSDFSLSGRLKLREGSVPLSVSPNRSRTEMDRVCWRLIPESRLEGA